MFSKKNILANAWNFSGNDITFVETIPPKMELESVKLSKAIVKMVRDNKIKTAVPIGKFIEMAILEKLKKKSR